MGPPGSDKDNLLTALRQRERPQLLVAHRYIIRLFNADSEDHVALSEHEFLTHAEQYLFTLSWHANNTYYGISVEIDLWLYAGFDVVINGSHAHLALAREHYGEVLVPTRLVVSSLVLRQWLEQRGRENAPEIVQRLDHATYYKPDNCLALNNGGSLRQPTDGFFHLLRSHVARVEDQPV